MVACDYTLIGEEFYAATAYLSREPSLLGTIKAQDYFKVMILLVLALGFGLESFKQLLPAIGSVIPASSDGAHSFLFVWLQF